MEGTTSRIIFILTLAATVLLETGVAQTSVSNLPVRARRRSPIESEIFLGDWWDYYNRAIRRIEKGDLRSAESDLREAVKLHPEDDPHARTYGVRFQEYYANLELGMLLYQTGHYAESVSRLQSSLKVAKLDETKFYLHEARRQLALERGDDQSIPQLALTQPPAGLVTNQNSVVVAGTVSDDLFVDEVYVGNESVLLPRAASQSDFKWEFDLTQETNRIPIVVRDLIGRELSTEIVVTLDQQGPVFNLKKIELAANGEKARIVGDAYDRRDVASIDVNGAPIGISGGTLVSIDQEVPFQKESQEVSLALSDGLGNVTRAILDPRIKVGKAHEAEVQVRVVAVGFDPRWLAAAATGPKIDLMGLESGQKVFLRELYIDGYVRDSNGIESIRFEGTPIDIPEGKDLYFGHLAGPLSEGTNNLEITAVNVDKIETKRLLNLQCQPPPEYDQKGRLSVTIPPFDVIGPNENGSKSAPLWNALQKVMTDRKRFNLAERDNLSALFVERMLGQSDVVDTRWRAGDQELTEADLILDGQLIVNEKTAMIEKGMEEKKSGNLEGAKYFFAQAAVLDPEDAYITSLIRSVDKEIRDQAAAAAAASGATARKEIRESLDYLAKQKMENPPPQDTDNWTSSPVAIAVIRIEEPVASPWEQSEVDGFKLALEDSFKRLGRWKVITRGEIQDVLLEKSLQVSQLTSDNSDSYTVAGLAGARALVFGGLEQKQGENEAWLRVVDISRAVIALETHSATGALAELAPALAEMVVPKLETEYSLRGRVIEVRAESVLLNIGTLHGVQVGDRFAVYPKESHPRAADRVVGLQPIGELEVISIEEAASACKALSAEMPLEEGMRAKVEE